MKSVLISIHPKWVEDIASGRKTIEVRKTRPKIETPFKCYIYCTKSAYIDRQKTIPKEPLFQLTNLDFETLYKCSFGEEDNVIFSALANGKVIGEFTCDKITDISVVVRNCNEDYNHVYHNDECKGSCLTWKELQEYGKGKTLYGWHISDLKVYDKPRELSEFKTVDIQAVRKCERREQSYFDGYCNNGGYLKNGFYCREKDDWCDRCKTKPITRPPQSWCYVEV
jgi:predicted transcriptional regulator